MAERLNGVEMEKMETEKEREMFCENNCKGYKETGKCFADGECNALKEYLKKL